MAEYIDIDAPIDVAVYQRNRRIQVTLRQILESNDAKYECADVRPAVKSKWADNHVSFYRGCPECGAFVRANLDEVFLRDFPSAVGKLNFCPNCGADMREEYNSDDVR